MSHQGFVAAEDQCDLLSRLQSLRYVRGLDRQNMTHLWHSMLSTMNAEQLQTLFNKSFVVAGCHSFPFLFFSPRAGSDPAMTRTAAKLLVEHEAQKSSMSWREEKSSLILFGHNDVHPIGNLWCEIFRYLDQCDLSSRCSLVCSDWLRYAASPRSWRSLIVCDNSAKGFLRFPGPGAFCVLESLQILGDPCTPAITELLSKVKSIDKCFMDSPPNLTLVKKSRRLRSMGVTGSVLVQGQDLCSLDLSRHRTVRSLHELQVWNLPRLRSFHAKSCPSLVGLGLFDRTTNTSKHLWHLSLKVRSRFL